jgi:hypothetical protein
MSMNINVCTDTFSMKGKKFRPSEKSDFLLFFCFKKSVYGSDSDFSSA